MVCIRDTKMADTNTDVLVLKGAGGREEREGGRGVRGQHSLQYIIWE